MSIAAITDKWLGRASNFWTFAAPVVPGTVGGIVTASLSTTVHWISQYGWFGWWVAGLCGFFVASVAYAAIGLGRKSLGHRILLEKWGKQVDAFNPLENSFTKKRMKIYDLASPINNRIEGKTFTDCELMGPANIVLVNDVSFTPHLFNCDIVPTKKNLYIKNAIGINDCKIYGGSIVNATIFIHPSILGQIEASNANVYYSTLTGDAEIDARKPNV